MITYNAKRGARTLTTGAGLVALLMALLSPRAEAQSTTPVAAATGDSLYACYVPNSGTVYRIRAAGAPPACVKSTHVPFGWPVNNGLRRVRQKEYAFPKGKFGQHTTYCAENEKAISGGYELFTSTPPGSFMVGRSRAEPYGQGWQVMFTSQYEVYVKMYVICAPV